METKNRKIKKTEVIHLPISKLNQQKRLSKLLTKFNNLSKDNNTRAKCSFVKARIIYNSMHAGGGGITDEIS